MSVQRMWKVFGSLLASVLLFSVVIVSPVLAQSECEPGTLFNPDTGVCAPVHDVREQYLAEQARVEVPNLMELRSERSESRAEEAGAMPPPGGIGAGTGYRGGALQALRQGELYTKMFVQPNGISPSNMNLVWLFTTSTNRIEKNVEVVGIYYLDHPGSLGVFDWSCSATDPCPGGAMSPSWIWTRPLSSLPCNMTHYVDQGKHVQLAMPYINQSIQLDQGDPPLWSNAVYLWNYCSEAWDLVYAHQYRAYQLDCSASGCSWWGPILEEFNYSGGPYPEIRELGFADSVLIHDGMRSELRPDETWFSGPISPWQLHHIDENRGYGVGNYVTIAVDIDIKPGSDPNCFNNNSHGVIPVAILGSADFDCTQVDPSTCSLEGLTLKVVGKRNKLMAHIEDVNNDGYDDLVLQIEDMDEAFQEGDTTATLTGNLYDGTPIEGTDTICIVP